MGSQDKVLTCRECGATFVFTVGEQQFYASKGLLNEPSHCPACRAARRNRSAGTREESERRHLHEAVCAACGRPALVPFEPKGDRPVYCSECYQRMRGQRA